MPDIASQFRPALVLTIGFTVLTGLAYPLAVTGIGQAAFPSQANGSVMERDGLAVGSALVGQSFSGPSFFHGRPSAIGSTPYDGANSSGSNLGPTSAALLDAVEQRALALGPGPHPADLVTASASGLDPHISPAAALAQVARVAAARGLAEADVLALVEAAIEPRQLGLLGDPRVNVLALNISLDLALDAARP
jgi:potassium-transporting ATPase KdpC subunit